MENFEIKQKKESPRTFIKSSSLYKANETVEENEKVDSLTRRKSNIRSTQSYKQKKQSNHRKSKKIYVDMYKREDDNVRSILKSMMAKIKQFDDEDFHLFSSIKQNKSSSFQPTNKRIEKKASDLSPLNRLSSECISFKQIQSPINLNKINTSIQVSGSIDKYGLDLTSKTSAIPLDNDHTDVKSDLPSDSNEKLSSSINRNDKGISNLKQIDSLMVFTKNQRKESMVIEAINNDRPLIKFQNIYDSASDEAEQDLNEGNKEKNDQDEAYDENKFLYIHPDSYFKKIWDYVLLIFIINTVIVTPIKIAFSIEEEWWSFQFIIEVMSDIVFALDLVINFFIPFYDYEENLVYSNYIIALHYLATWFFFDLLSSFPSTIIELIHHYFLVNSTTSIKLVGITSNLRFFKTYRLLKWTKMFRLLKLSKYNDSNIISTNILSKVFLDQGRVSRLIKSGIVFCLLVHVASCIWCFIGNLEEYQSTSWIFRNGLNNLNNNEIYLASMYFSLTTIYTIGYGDITAGNNAERLYNCFFMVTGAAVFSFMISSVSTMFESTDKVTKKYKRNLKALEEMNKDYNIGKDIFEKVKKSLRSQYKKNFANKYLLIEFLPKNLKNDLILKIHKEKIKDLIFLKDTPYDFIVTVLPMFVNVNYVKGDMIFCLGEFVEEMFLVVKGCLSIHLGYEYHNIEVAQIKVNHHFGDILMYSNEQSLIECKIKSRLSELLILKKLDHSKLKMKFPELITNSLKKSLENYKFIMERRVLFIKTITNTHSNDLEVIMKEIKKVRYKSSDRELINLQSFVDDRKEGLNTMNSKVMEKGRRNGVIDEKMLKRSVNQVINQIKTNITFQGGNTILENNTKEEINKFSQEINNDIQFYSELKNSNFKINENKTFVDLNSPTSPARKKGLVNFYQIINIAKEIEIEIRIKKGIKIKIRKRIKIKIRIKEKILISILIISISRTMSTSFSM